MAAIAAKVGDDLQTKDGVKKTIELLNGKKVIGKLKKIVYYICFCSFTFYVFIACRKKEYKYLQTHSLVE